MCTSKKQWALAAAILAMVSVTGAQAATRTLSIGDYANVTWQTPTAAGTQVGYVSALVQPDRTIYVYVLLQLGTQPRQTAWGFLPSSVLTVTKTGGLSLSLSARQVAKMNLQGCSPGAVSALWQGGAAPLTYHVGASGTSVGGGTQVLQGEWMSTATTASGKVLGVAIGSAQTAEVGSAGNAKLVIQPGS